MSLLFFHKKVLVQIDSVTMGEEFVGMTSRANGVDKTCQCEETITITVYLLRLTFSFFCPLPRFISNNKKKKASHGQQGPLRAVIGVSSGPIDTPL